VYRAIDLGTTAEARTGRRGHRPLRTRTRDPAGLDAEGHPLGDAAESDAGEAPNPHWGASRSPRRGGICGQGRRELSRNLEYPHGGLGREWKRCHPAFTLPGTMTWSLSPTRPARRSTPVASRSVAVGQAGARTRVVERTPVLNIDLDGRRHVVVTDNRGIVAERYTRRGGQWSRGPASCRRPQGHPASKFVNSPERSTPFPDGRSRSHLNCQAVEEEGLRMPEFPRLG